MDNQLIVFQRLAQISIQPQIFKYPLIHFRRENTKLSAAAFFRGVHGRIGVTNDALAVLTMLWSEGNTNRASCIDFNQANAEGLTQACQNARCGSFQCALGRFGGKDNKFITAKPRQ